MNNVNKIISNLKEYSYKDLTIALMAFEHNDGLNIDNERYLMYLNKYNEYMENDSLNGLLNEELQNM